MVRSQECYTKGSRENAPTKLSIHRKIVLWRNFLFLLKLDIITFNTVQILCLYACMCSASMRCLQRSEEGTGDPETRVTDGG